jgi:lysozyme
MQTNLAGVNLIKSFEGFRSIAYLDAVGILTIGWGCTHVNGVPVYSGQTCTKEDAEQWLEDHLRTFETLVEKYVTVDLNENQFSAIVSACYNIGSGKAGVKDGIFVLHSGNPSTFLGKLNDGDYEGAAEALLSWNKAGGRVLDGLTRRRLAERELFLTPEDGYVT